MWITEEREIPGRLFYQNKLRSIKITSNFVKIVACFFSTFLIKSPFLCTILLFNLLYTVPCFSFNIHFFLHNLLSSNLSFSLAFFMFLKIYHFRLHFLPLYRYTYCSNVSVSRDFRPQSLLPITFSPLSFLPIISMAIIFSSVMFFAITLE